MDLAAWDARHKEDRHKSDANRELPPPLPIIREIAGSLQPGKALDLACGTGRNALWLAQQGWQVTAVDGSPSAIQILEQRAGSLELHLELRVANLEKLEYPIEPEAWDLIVLSLYLQRDLFEPAKLGVKPGGVLIAILLLAEPGVPGAHRLQPGELPTFFAGWEILHSFEGRHGEAGHPVAEIAVRKQMR